MGCHLCQNNLAFNCYHLLHSVKCNTLQLNWFLHKTVPHTFFEAWQPTSKNICTNFLLNVRTKLYTLLVIPATTFWVNFCACTYVVTSWYPGVSCNQKMFEKIVLFANTKSKKVWHQGIPDTGLWFRPRLVIFRPRQKILWARILEWSCLEWLDPLCVTTRDWSVTRVDRQDNCGPPKGPPTLNSRWVGSARRGH